MNFEQHQRTIGNDVSHTQKQAVLARSRVFRKAAFRPYPPVAEARQTRPPGNRFTRLRGGADQENRWCRMPGIQLPYGHLSPG